MTRSMQNINSAKATRGSARTMTDIWIVLAVALAARLAYFFINSRANPSFDYLIMDSRYIDEWARAIAAGDAGRAVYFRGPLVPYLFALVHKLGGGVSAIVLLNHLAGAATCALVWRLARDYFSRAVALTAGLVAALYWPLIYFEGEVLIEPVYITLVMLSLWRVARAVANPTMVRLLLAGVCIGLAVLGRPTILVLLPVIPFAFAAQKTRTAWLRQSLVVAGACIVVLLPATIRNYNVGRAIVPVTWSGGLNFYIGNNPDSDGRSAYIPGAKLEWMGGEAEAIAIASEQAGDSLNAAQAGHFYTARAVDFITTEPVAAGRLFAKKLYMFWEGPER